MKITVLYKDTASHIDVRTWNPTEAFFPDDFHQDDDGYPGITDAREPNYDIE